jgi:hypothetical protein
MVTSVNRLVADRPQSVAHVAAPDPDIIMRRLALPQAALAPSSLSRPADWASAATLPVVEFKRVLDNNPQLEGRLTSEPVALRHYKSADDNALRLKNHTSG